MILQERVKLLLFVLLSISLNSFSTNTKFYNISDTYGITSGEAFPSVKTSMVLSGPPPKPAF